MAQVTSGVGNAGGRYHPAHARSGGPCTAPWSEPRGRRRGVVAAPQSRVGGGRRDPAVEADERGREPRCPALRRRDGDVPGSTTPTAATTVLDVGGGVAASTATTTAGPTCTSPGGGNPAALYRNESPTGGALRFAPDRVARDGPDGGHRRLSARHRRRRDRRPGGAAASAGRAAAGPRRLPLRGGRRRAGASTRRPRRRWPSAPPGRARPTLPTLAFGKYVEPAPTAPATAPDNEVVRPDVPATRLRSADPAHARLLHALDAVQRLGRVGATRPAGQQRPPATTTTRSATSSCWRIEPGRAAPRRTPPPTGGARCDLWGMGIASYDLTGDGYPEVYLTSQGANKLQTLAAGPTEPAYHDIGARARRRRRRVRSSAATRCRRPPGIRSSQDVNNDGLVDLLRHQGQRRRACPTTPMKDPNNLFLGQPDGTFAEGAEAAGIVDVRPRARRGTGRPQPRRPARPRGGQPAAPASRCGATSDAAIGRAPAAMGHWLAVRLQPDRAEPRCDRRRGSRSRVGDRIVSARDSPSAAATPAASSAGCTSASGTPTTGGGAGDRGPTARSGRG